MLSVYRSTAAITAKQEVCRGDKALGSLIHMSQALYFNGTGFSYHGSGKKGNCELANT